MTVQVSTMIALAYLCLIPVRVIAQDSITLRSSARPASRERVMLSEVATIRGDQSPLLEELVLPRSVGEGGEMTIDVAAVRAVVEQAAAAKGSKINLGRITFAGSACRVMEGAVFEEATPHLERVFKEGDAGSSLAAQAGDTIRSAIAAKIASTAGAAPVDVRASFDPRDEKLLGECITGRSLAVTSASSGEKLSFTVRLYDHDSLIAQGLLRVGVVVRRDVAVARQNISRGDQISADAVELQEQWLPLTVTPADAKTVAGCISHGRIAVGEVIEQRDIEPPAAIKKGDIVSLHCVSGGLEVLTTARALATGKAGESILFETIEWKTNVIGKVSGGGHAVAIAAAEGKPSAADGGKRPASSAKASLRRDTGRVANSR